MSVDFLRLPSKRLYADYYDLIKKPIALDDIKRQLEHGGYATFSEVKQDFEQCFRNAKRYNVKESQIWRDAKHLHVCSSTALLCIHSDSYVANVALFFCRNSY